MKDLSAQTDPQMIQNIAKYMYIQFMDLQKNFKALNEDHDELLHRHDELINEIETFEEVLKKAETQNSMVMQELSTKERTIEELELENRMLLKKEFEWEETFTKCQPNPRKKSSQMLNIYMELGKNKNIT